MLISGIMRRGWGGFGSPDPYKASAEGAQPSSWNRFSYVGGDPINYTDFEGLARCRVSYAADSSSLAFVDCTSDDGRFSSSTQINFSTDDKNVRSRVEAAVVKGQASAVDTMQFNAALRRGIDIAKQKLSDSKCAGTGKATQQNFTGYGLGELLEQYYKQGLLSFGDRYWNNSSNGPILQPFSTANPSGFSATNTGAVTWVGGGRITTATGGLQNASRITVNTNGFLFTGLVWINGGPTSIQSFQPDAFEGLSQDEVMAAGLIHELFHVVNAIPSDEKNSAQSMKNSETVFENCFKL